MLLKPLSFVRNRLQLLSIEVATWIASGIFNLCLARKLVADINKLLVIGISSMPESNSSLL